jgi:hypothetical protein
MLRKYPFLTRFGSKLLFEFLPATIASAIGAVLLSHYVRTSATTPPTVIADPASAEMLQMARDEHARIVVYLEQNGEARLLADVAAEKEMARIKASARAAMLAAQKARAAETRAAALAASVGDKSVTKVSARQLVHGSEGTAAVRQPLQLVDVANGTVQNPPVASTASPAARAVREEDNLLVTKWHETTSAVERVPGWVRSMVERLSDNIPPLSPLHLRPLHII